jgi:hypothetical protein
MEPVLLLQIIGDVLPPARGHRGGTVAGNNPDGGVDGRLGNRGGRAVEGD